MNYGNALSTYLGMLYGVQGLLQGFNGIHLLFNAVLHRRRCVTIFIPELHGSLIACAQLLQIFRGIIPGDYRILYS